ncbi:MAG: hypothetical protein ACPGR8_06375 [Limisphaerales bacterium]
MSVRCVKDKGDRPQSLPRSQLGGCVQELAAVDGYPNCGNGNAGVITRSAYVGQWLPKLSEDFKAGKFDYTLHKGFKVVTPCHSQGVLSWVVPVAGAVAPPVLTSLVLPDFDQKWLLSLSGAATGWYLGSAMFSADPRSQAAMAALVASTGGVAGALGLVTDSMVIKGAAAAGGYLLLRPLLTPVLEAAVVSGGFLLNIVNSVQATTINFICAIFKVVAGKDDPCAKYAGRSTKWTLTEAAAAKALTLPQPQRQPAFECLMGQLLDAQNLPQMGGMSAGGSTLFQDRGLGCDVYIPGMRIGTIYDCGSAKQVDDFMSKMMDTGKCAGQLPLTGLKMACGPILASVKNTKAAAGGNSTLAIANMAKTAAARSDTACDMFQKQYLRGLADTVAVDPATNRAKATCATGFKNLATNAVARTNQFRAMGWLQKRDGTFQDTCATQSQAAIIKNACPTANCDVFRGL